MVCQEKNSICPNAHCLQIKIGASVKIENDVGQHLWVATKEMHLTLGGKIWNSGAATMSQSLVGKQQTCTK